MQWMIEKKDRQKVALLEYLMQRPELRIWQLFIRILSRS